MTSLPTGPKKPKSSFSQNSQEDRAVPADHRLQRPVRGAPPGTPSALGAGEGTALGAGPATAGGRWVGGSGWGWRDGGFL